MLEIAPGWSLDVERGPDWLFVKLHADRAEAGGSPPVADAIWVLAQQHFANRVVIELDELETLPSYLVGQLVMLLKRIASRGGILRVCGLSPENQLVLRTCGLDARFPSYRNRLEAVQGFRPTQPR